MPGPRAKRRRTCITASSKAGARDEESLKHTMDLALRVCAQHPSCHSMALLSREFRQLQHVAKASVDATNWDPLLFRHFIRRSHHRLTELTITDVDLEPMTVVLMHSIRMLKRLVMHRCNLRVTGTKEMWVFMVMFAMQLNCWEHLEEVDLRECEGAGQVLAQMANRFSQAAYWQATRGVAPAFSGFPSLRTLNLAGCVDISDTSMLNLLSLTTLTSLNLSGCVRISAGFMFVAHMSWLCELDLSCSSEVDNLVLTCMTVGYPSKLWHENLKPEILHHRKMQGLSTTILDCPKGLTNLQKLSLFDCTQLDSSSLEHISRLTALTYLDVGGCKMLDTQAVKYISAATALKHLSLRGCRLLDSAALPPLGTRTSLTHLDLGLCNKIDGDALAHLTPCSNLTYLNLQGLYRVDGHSLRHLQQCTALRHLNVVGCSAWHLAGILLQLGSCCTALTHLEVPLNCHVDSSGLAYLARCTALEHLVLPLHITGSSAVAALFDGHAADDSLIGSAPARLPQLLPTCTSGRGTKNFRVHGAANGESKKAVALTRHRDCSSGLQESCGASTSAAAAGAVGLRRLRHLGLRMGIWPVDFGAALRHAGQLTALRTLDLQDCRHISTTAFERMAQLTNLQVLLLRHCLSVNAQALQHLTPLTKLTRLDLSGCHLIDGAAMSAVASLTSLVHLNLSGCPQVARRNGLEQITKLTTLQHLDLSACFARRSGTVLRYVASLPRLTRLSLQNCSMLDTQDLQELSVLPVLQHLDLYGCLHPGPGAADRLSSISSLTTLRYLELGCTHLHVRHVSTLVGLRYLGLYGCLVEEAAPQEPQELVQWLGGLTRLQSLDLRSNPIRANSLSGISQLVALTQLDLRGCPMIDAETLQHIMALNGCQVFLSGQQ